MAVVVKWKRCDQCGRDSIPIERVVEARVAADGTSIPAEDVEGICDNRRCPSKWRPITRSN